MIKISRLVHIRLKKSRSTLIPQAIFAIAIIALSSLSALPPVAGQTVTGSLSFPPRGEDNVFTGLIDNIHGFAYFATDTQPGMIIKIRLSDFARVATLILNPGEDFLSAGVIDPVNGYAYFGTFTPTGHIIKVRLSDLTRVGAISLTNPRAGLLTTAIIDATNGFAYFGSFFFKNGLQGGGGLTRIRLSDFTFDGTILLLGGSDLFGSAIDGNGFGYFSTFSSPGRIIKVQLSAFAIVNTLRAQTQFGATPIIDANSLFGYFPTLSDPGSILKVRLSDLTLNDTLTLNPGEADLNSGVIDTAEGVAYFGTGGGFSAFQSTPEIIKVNLSNFKRVATLTLQPYEQLLFLSAAGIIQTETTGGSFAYFGTYTSPAFIVKVKLSNLSVASTLTLQQGREWFTSSVIDLANGFVYFGTNAQGSGTGSATGAITRIRTSNFTDAGTLLLNPGEGPLCASIKDNNGFAYFSTGAFPAQIIKVRLSDFTRVAAITLSTGEDAACTAVIDNANGFAYFGTQDFPASVVKVRLSDFTIVGSVTLAESLLTSATIDVDAGFAYFGTNDFPGIIAKVRLADLTEVGSLTLNSGEDAPFAASIDPANGFAYFGTIDTPANLVRIRLSDFTENASLTLNEGFIGSIVIDLTHGFAYLGAQGFIVKVQLSTLTEVGSDPTSSFSDILFTASIDIAAGTAYFGVFSSPGKVYKVSL